MGDTRYYTMSQFGAVVWLTTLIVLGVITLLDSYYKISIQRRQIGLSGFALIVALFSQFIAEVIQLTSSIEFYLAFKTLFLIAYYLLIIYYFLTAFIAKKGRQDKPSPVALIIFGAAVLIWLVAPQTWWLYEGLFVLQYVLLSSQLTSHSLGVNLFTDIKKIVLDYVIITDARGNVVYASEQTTNSAFFSLQNKMNLADIDSFFNGHVTMRESFAKQFIRLKADKTYYFQFHKKEIYSNDKLGGYILTFVDISELIAMLDDYEAKREAVFKSNVRLRRYKDKVYQIERDKEVSHLLNEIANNQEKALAELRHDILQLTIDDVLFESKIDRLIARAKSNLSNVRQAVTTYKNYYGEGE